jgi:hypothetical protein
MSSPAFAARCSRYARANACDPACAVPGSPASNAISSTCVFGGTVTDTCDASRSAESLVFSTARARSATTLEVTSCASVSMLRPETVRAPACVWSAFVLVAWTRTELVAVYTRCCRAVNSAVTASPTSTTATIAHHRRRIQPV